MSEIVVLKIPVVCLGSSEENPCVRWRNCCREENKEFSNCCVLNAMILLRCVQHDPRVLFIREDLHHNQSDAY